MTSYGRRLAPSYTTRLAPFNSSHTRFYTVHTIAHRHVYNTHSFYLGNISSPAVSDSTRQTCDTDCYRIRHIFIESICFFLRLQRGTKQALISGLQVEYERTSLKGKKRRIIEQQTFTSRPSNQLAAAGMNRWGASPKCRNDLTVGIDSDAAASTSLNAFFLVDQTSYSPSRLTAWRNCARKSDGVSRLTSTLVCLFILLGLCSPCVDAAAALDYSDEQAAQALTSTESVLLFDRSTPPEPFLQHFFKRAAASTSSSASPVSTATSNALPRPFDAGYGNNFTTSSCPAFFKNFLSDDTFNECVPLSLLLQVSLDRSDYLHKS